MAATQSWLKWRAPAATSTSIYHNIKLSNFNCLPPAPPPPPCLLPWALCVSMSIHVCLCLCLTDLKDSLCACKEALQTNAAGELHEAQELDKLQSNDNDLSDVHSVWWARKADTTVANGSAGGTGDLEEDRVQ